MSDVRFSTALQLMLGLVLADREGAGLVSSSQLARGVAANPTLVRRMLATLARAGLVATSMGKNGGMRLARSAESIKLSEIYAAATAGKTVVSGRTAYEHRCVVSTNFAAYFDDIASSIDAALLAHLDQHTLMDSFIRLQQAGDRSL